VSGIPKPSEIRGEDRAMIEFRSAVLALCDRPMELKAPLVIIFLRSSMMCDDGVIALRL